MQNIEKDQKKRFKFSCFSERQITFLRSYEAHGLTSTVVVVVVDDDDSDDDVMTMTKDKHVSCVMMNDHNTLVQKNEFIS